MRTFNSLWPERAWSRYALGPDVPSYWIRELGARHRRAMGERRAIPRMGRGPPSSRRRICGGVQRQAADLRRRRSPSPGHGLSDRHHASLPDRERFRRWAGCGTGDPGEPRERPRWCGRLLSASRQRDPHRLARVRAGERTTYGMSAYCQCLAAAYSCGRVRKGVPMPTCQASLECEPGRRWSGCSWAGLDDASGGCTMVPTPQSLGTWSRQAFL